jgi:hypothetical protein
MRVVQAVKFGSLVVCASGGMGVAGGALAQSASPAQALLDQNVVVNVGAFLVHTDLKASLNGQTINNPEVDFDRAFGKANSSTRVRADALWRINPRHHLTLMYFDNRNRRTKVINESIQWGDNMYDVGSTVTSETEFKVGALAYEYGFIRQPGYEVSASIGLHVSELSLSLQGDSTVNGTPVSKSTQSNSVTAPLPVVGLRGAWVVAPSILLEAQGQFFKLKVNDIDGYWSDLRASATWMFNKSFGLGLGYDRFFNKVDVSKNGFDGRVKFGYSGLQAFVTGSF